MLFQADSVELTSLLQDTGDFNAATKATMTEANARYHREKAQEPPAPAQRGPVLSANPSPAFGKLKETREACGKSWTDKVAGYSAATFQTASQLSLAANQWLGPVLLGGVRQLGDGLVELKFHPQTSREFIHGTGNSVLTGEYIDTKDRRRNELPSGFQDPNLEVLFAQGSSRSLLVDTQSGLAALKPQ